VQILISANSNIYVGIFDYNHVQGCGSGLTGVTLRNVKIFKSDEFGKHSDNLDNIEVYLYNEYKKSIRNINHEEFFASAATICGLYTLEK